MESEEQWSCRDFTQIKPRRPEGPADEEWEEEEAASTFSFLWSTHAGEEDVVVCGDGRRGDHHADEDGSNESKTEELQEEFEFSSAGMATTTSSPATVVERLSPSGISPADELFFKGQLLPLHLPPRIQMVKKLSLEKQQQQQEQQQDQQQQNEGAPAEASQFRNVHRNEEIIARVNALMQARFSRLFQPKYSKFCISATEVAAAATPARLGNSWWDPRGSHDSSAASFTSTDRDSSDSTSSRDSSGSSQDCFDKDHHFHVPTDSKGFLHNREVFSTHSTHPGDRAGGISTWLRPPFKWKVLFGAKKTATTGTGSKSGYDISVEPKAHSMEKAAHYMEAPPEFFSASPVSTDRYYSDCSGELTPSGNLHLSSRAFIHGGDMEKYPRGMERARGYLQRYMKALNPSRSKDHNSSHGHGYGNGSDDGAPARASPAITTSRSFPPFSQSFRISPKDISLKMKRPPAPASPLPGPRRVSTSSASSELHSAIQGAIAHCKESQKQSRQDVDVQLQSSKSCAGNVQKVAGS